jgi:DNA-binding transcriptional LysR family regulator
MSKLEQIEAFIAVVEEQGFAAAARKQALSTAAISRQVTRLESELKTDLLYRSTRQVSLTEIGHQYYQQCKKILRELSDLEVFIAGEQSEASGILSITSSRYFAIKFLIPRLPEFIAQNPKLTITLELAERFPDLVNENIDIGFSASSSE